MSDSIAPVIEFRDVRKYYGDREVLRGVDLALYPGEILGLIGPNGVGKTTLAKILMGKVLPDGGQVLWQGEPMRRAFLKRIGFLPEERELQRKMGVRSQLEFAAQINGAPWDAAPAQVQAIMDRLGIGQFAESTLENLSLGEQQRVQLAAALGHHPDVLILDEPDSGLDPESADLFVAVIREQAAAGVGVLVTSHHTPFLYRFCDRVLILTERHIAAEVAAARIRESGVRRFRVHVDGLTPGWAAGIAGAVEIGPIVDGVSVVELPAGVDQQRLVNTALTFGTLREFTEITDILHDIYLGVLAEQPGWMPPVPAPARGFAPAIVGPEAVPAAHAPASPAIADVASGPSVEPAPVLPEPVATPEPAATPVAAVPEPAVPRVAAVPEPAVPPVAAVPEPLPAPEQMQSRAAVRPEPEPVTPAVQPEPEPITPAVQPEPAMPVRPPVEALAAAVENLPTEQPWVPQPAAVQEPLQTSPRYPAGRPATGEVGRPYDPAAEFASGPVYEPPAAAGDTLSRQPRSGADADAPLPSAAPVGLPLETGPIAEPIDRAGAFAHVTGEGAPMLPPDPLGDLHPAPHDTQRLDAVSAIPTAYDGGNEQAARPSEAHAAFMPPEDGGQPAFEYSTSGTDWPQTTNREPLVAPQTVIPPAAYADPVTAPALAASPSGDDFATVQPPNPDVQQYPVRRSAWAPVAEPAPSFEPQSPEGSEDPEPSDRGKHWWSRRR